MNTEPRWVAMDSGLIPEGYEAGLLDEEAGGFVAFFMSYDAAAEVANTLNQAEMGLR